MASGEAKTSLKNAYPTAKKLFPKAEEGEAEADYCTPGAFELERLFWKGSPQYTHVNEVWPQLYIGDEATALDRYGLQKAGFTHVLNAAHGRWNVDTGPDYYRDMPIEYHGVEADDLPTFDLSVFFYSAAAFIDSALRDDHNKILVHCAMGRSRSATLVLAYLMIHRNMTLVDAIQQVAKNRCVLPNRGFLKQLRELDRQLVQQRRQAQRGEGDDWCWNAFLRTGFLPSSSTSISQMLHQPTHCRGQRMGLPELALGTFNTREDRELPSTAVTP